MAYLSQIPGAESILDAASVGTRSARRLPLAARISSITTWIVDYIETAAEFYAAAALYEQLSRLSDVELKRRGLSRGDLARDVSATCNRVAHPD
jgi:hypothetical protein